MEIKIAEYKNIRIRPGSLIFFADNSRIYPQSMADIRWDAHQLAGSVYWFCEEVGDIRQLMTVASSFIVDDSSSILEW